MRRGFPSRKICVSALTSYKLSWNKPVECPGLECVRPYVSSGNGSKHLHTYLARPLSKTQRSVSTRSTWRRAIVRKLDRIRSAPAPRRRVWYFLQVQEIVCVYKFWPYVTKSDPTHRRLMFVDLLFHRSAFRIYGLFVSFPATRTRKESNETVRERTTGTTRL